MSEQQRDKWLVSYDPDHTTDIRICRQNPDSEESDCVCCLALMGETDADHKWNQETVDEWLETAEQIVREHNTYMKLAEALRYLKAFPTAPKAHECAGAALDAAGIEYGEEA